MKKRLVLKNENLKLVIKLILIIVTITFSATAH